MSLLLTLAAGLAPGLANATVIVANTAVAQTGFSTISPNLFAAGFLSPSVGTTVSSADLLLQITATRSLVLSLWDDDSGEPGAFVADLGTTSASGIGVTVTFTPPVSPGLTASTQYWLVLGCTDCSTGLFGWQASSTTTVAGLAGADVTQGILSSSNGGTTWGSPATDRTFIFQVNGDAAGDGNPVPEPASLALMGAGLTSVWWLRRRRNRV